MILGVGTDLVACNRFNRWQGFSRERLQRVFAEEELAAAMVNGQLSPEKLAARFAAKEAFYKALAAALVQLELTVQSVQLLAICRVVLVRQPVWGVPQLEVDWDYLQGLFACTLPPMMVHCSLTHEREMAMAFVVISRAYGA